MLAGIDGLENAKAKQLGAMILAASQRLDQLWQKCTPAMVLGWISKTQVGAGCRPVTTGHNGRREGLKLVAGDL